MNAKVQIGGRWVGFQCPTYFIAEIGINHNGSLAIAKAMIDGAAAAGCHAVKFQKRTPELCVPRDQWMIERETPWGRMTYIDYRRRVEFSYEDYLEIDRHCKKLGIDWFTSCWDEEAVEFMEKFDTPAYKVASACLTDHGLLHKMRSTGRPVILSTGMSTMEEINGAIEVLGQKSLLIAHTVSSYPCKLEELNLNMIMTLKNAFPNIPVGYSGHEAGLVTTYGAVALGACFVERHITLDRAMWGSDQSASLVLDDLKEIVAGIREIDLAMGDGVKRVYASEESAKAKLRRVVTASDVIFDRKLNNSVSEALMA